MSLFVSIESLISELAFDYIIPSTMDDQTLIQGTFIRMLERNPNDVDAWMNLGDMLQPGETVSAGGHSNLTAKDCFLQILRIDPKCAPAWFLLSESLQPGATLSAAGQSNITQKDCFVQMLRIDPSCVPACGGLGDYLVKRCQLEDTPI